MDKNLCSVCTNCRCCNSEFDITNCPDFDCRECIFFDHVFQTGCVARYNGDTSICPFRQVQS